MWVLYRLSPASSLRRPRATCSSCGSSPNSPSAGRTIRAPLLPVTQRWVLVPLLSKSNVIVSLYRGYLRIFFRKSNKKVTFKTEVPRRQRVSSSWLIHSHVFLLPYRYVTLFLLRKSKQPCDHCPWWDDEDHADNSTKSVHAIFMQGYRSYNSLVQPRLPTWIMAQSPEFALVFLHSEALGRHQPILAPGLPKMNAIRWVGKVRLPRSLDSVVKNKPATVKFGLIF